MTLRFRTLLPGLLLGVLAAAAAAAEDQDQVLPPGPWFERRYNLREESYRVVTAAAPQPAPWPESPVLPISLPTGNEFYTKVDRAWTGWQQLVVRLRLPAGYPANAETYFFIKDWDDAWLHIRAVLPAPTADGLTEVILPIAGLAATKAWQPRGHYRPWHQLTPSQLDEFGAKFSPPKGDEREYQGKIQVAGLILRRVPEAASSASAVFDLRLNPVAPPVGSLLEVSFRVATPFRLPFDRSDVDLRAEITPPQGNPITIPAFYFEDFVFDENDLRSRLVPSGYPEFRVRYTPLLPGRHRLRVSGKVGGTLVSLPEQTFEAAPPPAGWRGYVTTSTKDKRLLACSVDGSEFFGVGINVRSSYDTRYMASFPFSSWQNYNLNMYRDLFPKYRKAGINVVEVWMSPWWLALEWIPDAPGNHGVGYLNQFRAWQLDRLCEWAEANDLYLILVFNNHGKFSAWIDVDWDRSPFNVANGGWLEQPSQYFSDARARVAFNRLADYVVARWGYSPHVLAWKLFTEIDLTGDKGSNRTWYQNSIVAEWHRESAAYLKKIDPNRHLVTTHWATSYQIASGSPRLAALPELDLLTLDIYYDAGGGAQALYNFMYATYTYGTNMRKPWIITEFGGSPYGDTIAHIRNQLHLGLWSGFFFANASAPCFWWFPLVDEQDLYPEYRALARFAKGEGRTGGVVSQEPVAGTGLVRCDLRCPDQSYTWVFDATYYFSGNLTAYPRLFDALELPVSGMVGECRAEVWSCQTGELLDTRTIDVLPDDDQHNVLKLPPFRRDVAIKFRHPRSGAGAPR